MKTRQFCLQTSNKKQPLDFMKLCAMSRLYKLNFKSFKNIGFELLALLS